MLGFCGEKHVRAAYYISNIVYPICLTTKAAQNSKVLHSCLSAPQKGMTGIAKRSGFARSHYLAECIDPARVAVWPTKCSQVLHAIGCRPNEGMVILPCARRTGNLPRVVDSIG